jgi:SAM-dependent methyltransferase
MADPVSDTLAWYRAHAEDFAAQTCRADLGLLHDRFLHYVEPSGRILDAGCGPGRDTAAFIARGYEVVAFDATEEMVRLARSRTGHGTQIHRMRYEDVAWTAEFDGILADQPGGWRFPER